MREGFRTGSPFFLGDVSTVLPLYKAKRTRSIVSDSHTDMKPYTLATILVKILGLSIMISGFSQILSSICTFLFYTKAYQTDSAMLPSSVTANQLQQHLLGETLTHVLPYGIVFFGLGLLLLTKSSYIVRSLLKIDSND
jgi:hypothetical protein